MGMKPARDAVKHIPHFITEKAKLLEAAGIDQAHSEIEWILCHVTNLDRLHLYLNGIELLSDARLKQIDEIITKRLTRYPLQYILEESFFFGRKFFVSAAVMVPTPETEGLVERALGFARIHKLSSPRILDIGTGSGVIAVTLACELPDASVLALDISRDALEVAAKNANTLSVNNKIKFRQSDLFASLDDTDIKNKFDLILSNPPYIAEPDYAGLMPEVHADPQISLTSGEEGMDIIKRIIIEAPRYLAPNGRIIFEIGYDQSVKVAALTECDDRYTSIDIIKDLNDIDRLIILGCD